MTEATQVSSGFELDAGTIAIYLEVPRSQIVLLQVIFESYEGVAIVRTLSPVRSLVSLLFPPTQHATVLAVLHSIAQVIPWRMVPQPSSGETERELGYYRKSKEEKV